MKIIQMFSKSIKKVLELIKFSNDKFENVERYKNNSNFLKPKNY